MTTKKAILYLVLVIGLIIAAKIILFEVFKTCGDCGKPPVVVSGDQDDSLSFSEVFSNADKYLDKKIKISGSIELREGPTGVFYIDNSVCHERETVVLTSGKNFFGTNASEEITLSLRDPKYPDSSSDIACFETGAECGTHKPCKGYTNGEKVTIEGVLQKIDEGSGYSSLILVVDK